MEPSLVVQAQQLGTVADDHVVGFVERSDGMHALTG